ncbi:MAG: hypothetical protein V4574_00255 [Pseudomonadota bacterium]
MRHTAFLIALTVAAAAPVSAAVPQHKDGEAALQALLEGRVAGKAEACVRLPGLGSSQVIDGVAIVYQRGSRLYVNRPRSGASALKDDNILVTRTSGGMLCNVDTVDLVDRYSRMPSGFVILGDFVPYDKVRTAK